MPGAIRGLGQDLHQKRGSGPNTAGRGGDESGRAQSVLRCATIGVGESPRETPRARPTARDHESVIIASPSSRAGAGRFILTPGPELDAPSGTTSANLSPLRTRTRGRAEISVCGSWQTQRRTARPHRHHRRRRRVSAARRRAAERGTAARRCGHGICSRTPAAQRTASARARESRARAETDLELGEESAVG
jgi:hypothetical protein